MYDQNDVYLVTLVLAIYAHEYQVDWLYQEKEKEDDQQEEGMSYDQNDK